MKEFTQYILPNGIRCLHKQVRSAVAHCALTVNTGSRDELPAQHGLAHLLEHAFFKGTTRRKAYHINCRLENLGGELNAFTTKEETVIHATTLQSDLAKAVELITDIAFHSTFPEKEVEKEKLIILDEINAYKDSPVECIYDEFEDLLFAGSSLGHNILGDKRSLKRFTRSDLQAFVERTYHTDQMVFSVIGNLSARRFEALCDRYLGDFQARNREFMRDTPQPTLGFSRRASRHHHQSHCMMGTRAYSLHHPQRNALSLLINILGGPSANSLLNMSVRERHGLCYTIEAGYTPLSNTGIACIYFGTEKEKVDQCTELIHRELQFIKEGKMTARTFGMAKKQFLGQIVIGMESNENYMLGAARSYLHFNHLESSQEFQSKIMNLTLDEMILVANDLFNPTQIATLLYP